MSSKSFADNLREEVRKLENEGQRVDDLAQVARNNRRNFNDCFTEWQQSANKALEEARNLLDAFDKASKTCCYGTLPDPKCRYQFSTKAEAEIQVIRGLAQDCIRFRAVDDICSINTASGNVTAPTPARRDGKDADQLTTATAPVFSAATSIKLGNDDVFESRALMIRKIMGALADNSYSVVGVYGMGGIGKSTLLVDVERKIREGKSFDWVAKADVSENPDIKTIQGEIADALGLTEIKEKETISGRARLLHGRLKDEEREKKKVLIILDNLWKGLELNTVGIPCGHDNRVIGCKLLLTSRHRDVLRSMGCDKDFSLGGLKDEEARSLFERLVGDKVHDDKFKPLVDEALHKCFGMPFLIVHMANVFKLADLPEWKNVLEQIKLSKNEVTWEVINERLQLSYENLKAAEKSLLALCVACGTSKPSFENLVRYGVGCGLFREDDNMEEARKRLRWQIRTLQASSLLLDSEDVDGFKIHDLVREFVASVISSDHPLLVLKDKYKSITGWLKDKLKSCRAVCFPYVDMKELPQELDCPKLQIFLLFTNNESLEVPYSLFRSMRKLMVLSLTGIRLTYSPSSSFQFLENLHTLCLDSCSLDNVAILGELKGLQILSFVNSNIYQLPREIGQLVELRLLDLNHCPQLEIIEPGVLQSLINLEELYIQNSFAQWNAMDQTPPTNASLIELNHMKNLNTLHVSIPDPRMLSEDLNLEKLTKYEIQIGNVWLEKLTKYEIQIGNVWRWLSECKGSRTLKLELDPLGDVLQKGCIQSILGQTDNLFLDKLDRNKLSVCALSQKGFPELKHLQVKNNSSIHYILQLPSHTHFTMLESLLLENLINLEMICNGHISSKSLSTLKVIQVERCDKMEVLFPLSVVRGLPQLEEIKVVGCKRMRGIVDADDSSKVELHNLRVLKLCDLPNIKSFLAVGTASLSSTLLDQVGTQIAFFNEQQVAFSKLETLQVHGLDNVEFLFSPSMIKSLAQLRVLQVSYCKKMEAIIAEEGGLGLEISETLAFPMLTRLNLYHLKSLMCFSRKKCSPEARSQDLIKSYCTTLFSQEVAFSKLETLEVNDLDNVEFLFSPSMIKSLAQLRFLRVLYCKKIEAIIAEEEGLGLEISETLAFPMLTSLNLEYLESLMCFSRKKLMTGSREARSQDRIKLYCTTLFNQEVAVSKLETLEVHGLDNVEFLFSPSMIKSLAQLRVLRVCYCKKMEAIIAEEEGLGLEVSETLAFPMLTSLHLEYLESLMCFSCKKLMTGSRDAWSEDRIKLYCTTLFSQEVAFSKLETLQVDHLDNVEFLFSPSMIKSLEQLRDLQVCYCKMMEAIIAEEEGLGLEISETVAFPMLTSLNLKHLKSLMCFSRKKCSQEAGSQGRIKSYRTTLFSQEVAFSKLETIEVDGLDNVEFLFSPSMIKSLAQLRVLRVHYCKMMEAIIAEEEWLGLEISETLAFPMLTSLNLEFLESLMCFSRKKCSREARSQDRIKLYCTTLFSQEVAFSKLETLQVHGLDNVEFLFSPSMIKSLAQLRVLQVSYCKKMEAIIAEEEGLGLEISETLAFPMLTSLNLKYLESLMCFSRKKCSREAWSEDRIKLYYTTLFSQEVAVSKLETLEVHGLDNVEFLFSPSMIKSLAQLRVLRVRYCKKMEAIIAEEEGLGLEVSETLAFPMLTSLNLEYLESLMCFSCKKCSRDAWSEDRIKLYCTTLFSQEVAFPKLWALHIESLDNIEMIWDNKIAADSFPKLKTLCVVDCNKLVSVVHSFILRWLLSLESLDARSCGSLEVVFELQTLNHLDGHPIPLPLKELRVSSLPKLKCIWDKELYRQFKFQCLRSINISRCERLTSLFPTSVARGLIQLEKLEIDECGIVEIIENEEGLVPRFVFPKLTSLKLNGIEDLEGASL